MPLPLFIPSLKQRGLLEHIHLTLGIIGSRQIENEDAAYLAWDLLAPNLTIYGFDADSDACDQINESLAARQINWTEKHVPVVLWSSPTNKTIYCTRSLACSSLYPPNEPYIQRFVVVPELMQVDFTVEVETTTLDHFCDIEGIERMDFLQIDTQGADLEILRGAAQILSAGTLAVVTEVEFMELYQGQPLFGEVDTYLNQQGFTLFDLSIHRESFQGTGLISQQHPGPLCWADAFYFRDLLQNRISSDWKTPQQLLKLACIADILNFPDYALELLTHLTLNYSADSRYNFAAAILESLAQVPALQANGLDTIPVVQKLRLLVNE